VWGAGINAEGLPADLDCHHLIVNSWEDLEAPQNVCIGSIPTVFNPRLAPPGKALVHAYTAGNEPYSVWEGKDRNSDEYRQLKVWPPAVLLSSSLLSLIWVHALLTATGALWLLIVSYGDLIGNSLQEAMRQVAVLNNLELDVCPPDVNSHCPALHRTRNPQQMSPGVFHAREIFSPVAFPGMDPLRGTKASMQTC
jgi:hypothetical protein